jgi:hypothetical protein
MKKQSANLKVYENSFYQLAEGVNKKNAEIEVLQGNLILKENQISVLKTQLKALSVKDDVKKHLLHSMESREKKKQSLSQMSDNLELPKNRNVEESPSFNVGPPVLKINQHFQESEMYLSEEEVKHKGRVKRI